MPKGSEELTSARKEEILNACAALYETMSFRDITLRDIGERTSFTRTSIYNYFQTKEEIFLALLQREHERWAEDLEAVLLGHTALSPGEFAGELARTQERRGCIVKLTSRKRDDIEGNSRMENLVAFKRAYAGALGAVTRCLEKFFPAMGEGEIRGFLYSFFPFLFGVYPYACHTEKQERAMELARVQVPRRSVYQLTAPAVEAMLRFFLPQQS